MIILASSVSIDGDTAVIGAMRDDIVARLISFLLRHLATVRHTRINYSGYVGG